MTETAIKIFDVNTDAVATNRGFYYQYLVVLEKWVSNYISEKNDFIYSEVEDDIKEVGDKLVFTQVKCYSNNFSFKSIEIKKSIFNYFILFLKNDQSTSTEFCFNTNTGIVKTEKLLKAWLDDPHLVNKEIRAKCLLKIKSILIDEIKLRKRKKIESKGSDGVAIDEIKLAAEELKNEVDDLSIEKFIKCIKWEFSAIDTDKAIDLIFGRIRQLLHHEKFGNKPVSLLESVLLSEIYRCSQIKEKNGRVLSNTTIKSILEHTDQELEIYVHKEFLHLIGANVEEIKQSIKKLQNGQEKTGLRLDTLDGKVEKLQNKNILWSYPKELTSIPFIFNENFYGREDCLIEIDDRLKKSRILSVHGSGGAGKTLLIQKYLIENYSKFSHVIWANTSQSLANSVVFNTELVRNLNLKFSSDQSEDDKFQTICNELSKIDGYNLLVIDDYEDDLINLKRLISLSSWKVIITTREVIPNLATYKLPVLDYQSVLSIYNNNLERTVIDEDSTFIEFFSFVDYNPLIIELFARTISSSLDLDLALMLKYLKNQNLEDEELGVDVLVPEENYPVRLLSYLHKKFEFRRLSRNEEWYLEFLALLPSEDILIDDLACIGGIESYKKNKIHFTNLSNSLHRKGWVERNGGKLKMHRLVQELIIYNTRDSLSPFSSCSFLVVWLIHRIDENAQYAPNKSFKYLKYAESILFSIKEQYRTSLYQPLLMLENALLHAYGWTNISKILHSRWENLLERAKKHLVSDDKNLAVVYNNVGLSFANQDEIENSLIYYIKAVKILEKNESESIDLLINSLNNLIHNYFALNDIENAQKLIKRVAKFKRKYPKIDEQFSAVHYNVIGFGYQKANDLGKAASYYEKAIQAHLSIDKDKRNDFHLSVYYANIIGSLFLLEKHDKVIKNLFQVTKVLKEMKISENHFLINIYESLGVFYAFYNDLKTKGNKNKK